MPSAFDQPQPLTAADVAALMRVQAGCYGPHLLESADLYAQRLASPVQCSWGVRDGAGVLVAYLAAYWSVRGAITPLHGAFKSHPQPDTLYLHDLAVRPAQAGQGLAQMLLQVAWRSAAAQGIEQAALVSVQSTQRFWLRQGFAAADAPPDLASYGGGAVYMTRLLNEKF
ncbi:GNAT family N-acetyltransferase [Ottowia sp.]|uniref:GNAT family N-acetyltransferase n=1 Tax=Ottowia sp. TaxID=1898956 RepID=UPI003A895672